ncbi:hypothetical protein FCL47_23680 [Desulfopila sp. IMCC35006]|uniref:hypothetical protein n=1 Tax=Desulfopila sp. IMCC35006 TaxID=2569542 RepID=UPI0010AD5DDD|nr:hypothetical protein [Desulfopila sp. IMCC35006]TKB23157.1 hypothetical protein FCL47_23680 [Desulfopila sp. IMCC35006]
MNEQEPKPEISNMPQLPDGIGLSLDEVRSLLASKNSITVSPDDPILMMVTLLNAFLTEEEKLLDRHRKALTSILTDKTDTYIKAVEQTTVNLSESISALSGTEIKKIFNENSGMMNSFRSNMVWLAAIVGISALVNVAVFVLR